MSGKTRVKAGQIIASGWRDGHATPLLRLPQGQRYYQRIETYARKIRRSDINIIISILDEALRKPAPCTRRQRTARARKWNWRRIDALKKEVLRGLIHIDHLTGALNRSGLDQAFIRSNRRPA